MLDAYAAGLFDGEGFVRVDVWHKPDSNHTRYQVIASIGMVHYPVIKALQDEYGGSLLENRHDLRNPVNRIQFNWRVASQIACRFLKRVQPYLIVKADQVALALTLQEHIDRYRFKLGNQHRSHQDRALIFEERAAIAAEIKRLKKVAFPSLDDNGPVSQ